MRRTLLFAAAAAVIAILTAVALTAAAQSVRWTGHYYLAVDESVGGPAAVVGRHEAWSDAIPISALRRGEYVDIGVRPREMGTSSVAPDNRYEVLAVANREGLAYSVAGFENESAPMFAPEADLIEGIGAPLAVAATSEGYLVVGTRLPIGPILTGDYVVAYGEPNKWYTAPGPDFRGGPFVDLAVAPSVGIDDQLDEVLAIGIYEGQGSFVRGYLDRGQPLFDAMQPEPIPNIAIPIAVEWTGAYYLIMGLDARGAATLVFGRPGAWSESKVQIGGDVYLSDLAVAPVLDLYKGPTKHYDLLAIGRTVEGTVTLVGEEYGGEFPMLVEKWAMIPAFGVPGLTAPVPAAVTSAPAITAGPNPFSNHTTLQVSVSREQAVLVEVFDAIGRRVTVLHNAVLSADRPHTFTLDAAGLPGGVYHFRVSGVDFDESRQVTLVR
jgi:hypothetical protein